MSETEFTVADMPHVYVSEDAERVELTFRSDTGNRLRLAFSADEFERLASQAIQLFPHVRNQKQATSGHLGIRAVEVVDGMAEAATGGGKVILGLRGTQGLLYSFAVHPDLSARLRPALRKAEESAKRQKDQTRM
jgi:hypothetical protein